MHKTVLALGGDGIGPEILDQGLRVVRRLAELSQTSLSIEKGLLHGASWEAHKKFCTDSVLEQAKASDAVLVGAVGGPKWDKLQIDAPHEERDGLMRLRKAMKAFFGLRPARYYPQLHDLTPYAKGKVEKSEIMVLREMCGGVMFAPPRGIKIKENQRYAYDTAGYTESEIRQFAICGFELAKLRRKHLVSIDKSNVMESYRLWREVVQEVSNDYKDVEVKHLYADNCAFQMVMRPKDFDIVLACNFLGDLFSDLAGIISGGLGMLPSASLCRSPGGLTNGIYEPVHGSAPDLIGTGSVNPIGMILSVGMMFDYSFERKDLSKRIENAVNQILEDGCLTPDLGGTASTEEVTRNVIKEILQCP